MKKVAILAAITLPLVIAAQTRATSGFAQALAEYPKCSLPCLAESMAKTTCNSTDTACICADKPIQESVGACVLQKCTIQEALSVKNITYTTCGMPVRDRSATYAIVTSTLLSISGLFVVQRFAYKLWAGLDFGWDDGFCLLIVITGIPATVLEAHWVSQNGMGRDVWTLTADQITKFGLGFYITAVVYFLQVTVLKLSLLFFYIRIFPIGLVHTLLQGTLVFVSMFGLVYQFLVIFQCTPVSYFWKRWDGLHHGHCIDINALVWSNAGISIAIDLWMLAIPMWQLRTLQLDWRRKIGVGLMFGVGTFVTVVSILRLRSLVKFRAESQNATWEFFDVSIWSNIEINVGIMCICMPSLRLLLVRLFPKLLGTTQRYYAKYSHSGNKSAPGNREQQHRGFGTVSTSRAEPDIFQGPHELGQISYKKSYTVNYGERDDAELVFGASDIDMRSAKSLTSISARPSSDKGPRAL